MGLEGAGTQSLELPALRLGRYERVTDPASPEVEKGGSAGEGSSLRKRGSRRYVYACALLVSLNSILLGYDVGVMSGAVLFIQEDLKVTEVQEEVLVGCLSIVSILGSICGGKASDAIGRKWTIAFAAVVFQSGAATMALASSFPALMVGRLISGVGIGFGIMIAPVYIAEISPSVARGALTSFPEIFINLGILLGYVSNYAFSGLPVHYSWRVMLGVGILPSVFVAFALFTIPESPRWLVMKNRVEEARAVLMSVTDRDGEVAERLAEIEEAARTKDDEKAVWKEVLYPSPAVRRMLITGFGIQCFQQITGIDATVYYSPTIFAAAGIKSTTFALAATVAMGITKTLFILLAIILIDRVGRKPLLYCSTIGMTTCLFGIGLSLTLVKHEFLNREIGIGLVILFVCGNVAFFSVGMGPICWVLTSEIFPLRLRSQASALGSVGNRVSSGLITMSFLSVSHRITVGGVFFLFSMVSALSVAFVSLFVPETKGVSLEQIELMFQSGKEWKVGEIELGDAERLVQKE